MSFPRQEVLSVLRLMMKHQRRGEGCGNLTNQVQISSSERKGSSWNNRQWEQWIDHTRMFLHCGLIILWDGSPTNEKIKKILFRLQHHNNERKWMNQGSSRTFPSRRIH